MRIVIGSDHAGLKLKDELKRFLQEEQHDVIDAGTQSSVPVDYPDIAQAVATSVADKSAERGILICGSGVGVSVAANKFRGIRAGLCHDTYSAHQGVEHDDMNILVMGARVIGVELGKDLVRIYLDAKFAGEQRHVRRLQKVTEIERSLCPEV